MKNPDSEAVWYGVYHVELCYGGPEEGGWWYEAGERVPFSDLDPYDGPIPFGYGNPDLEAIQKALDAGVNQGRRELSSVLSTGRYIVRTFDVDEGLPKFFPTERPYYS